MNSPTYRFIPAMFHAVMQRRKTQTRRVITPVPPDGLVIDRTGPNEWHIGGTVTQRVTSPFGHPGTVKPVVTTWAVRRTLDHVKPMNLQPDECNLLWWDDGVTPKPDWAGKSRPSMFFPSHLYHLAPQARCVVVKAERVQDISEADAIAEGATPSIVGSPDLEAMRYRLGFRTLWDSINERRGYGWQVNPLVFATTFELVQ